VKSYTAEVETTKCAPSHLLVVHMELMKGVHVIETLANCALLTDDRLILVDTGMDSDASDVLSYLRRINYKPEDISSIVITHTHPDHVGGLAALKEKSEAEVAAHRLEADYISRRSPYPGPPGPQRHRACPVDVLLEDGDRYQELLVIHTPGHTPGSIALLDETRDLLIAGDAVQTQSGAIEPMSDTYNIDPAEHRHSIKKVAAYDFEALIVGHGKPWARGAARGMRELAGRL
jgi:glyoxylase-like metal-dependent hydrolase (beta-lactamase superfamily II)